jgi:hypothetical protein
VCNVWVSDVILFQSAAGPLDEVIDQVLSKIKAMSQRALRILGPDGNPPDTV